MPTLHEKIRREFEDRIHAGTLSPGMKLPTEMELCETYGVSRVTAQRVLNDLADAGLAVRRRRQGTFVADVRQQINLLSYASPETHVKGVPGRHEVLSARVVRAADAVLELPGAEGDTAVVELVRRKLDLHDQPRTVERHVVLFSAAPELLNEDLAELVSLPYLRDRGVPIDRIRVYLDPVVLDEHDAELLRSEAGTPTLRRRRELRAPDGTAIEIVTALIRPGTAEFFVEFPA
ncbi:GntR family transcriptional regulator, histidine utilization repressor [Saccharopolyspora kobensis]|uniref:GntR family transcriptional regulator, histidine utilization repressor n=1 Tax=Saccharopolyspora kobensis TaxID=146035 RepID=A0A1H6CAZ4_9PSEU|nr:GntR family transcriptional regulator [Saccharopolyspora kobensis]SEG70072.1 GntR family transcriptional regulator, histidine utilization repressor [Saccharopolyspora kobensis]SFC34065.1 transcriptional regulator, GntR family [Saccharopolyspora kobensis]